LHFIRRGVTTVIKLYYNIFRYYLAEVRSESVSCLFNPRCNKCKSEPIRSCSTKRRPWHASNAGLINELFRIFHCSGEAVKSSKNVE